MLDATLIVVAIAVDMALTAAFLWLAMVVASKFQGMPAGSLYCSYGELLICVVVASLVGFLVGLAHPIAGWLASVVALFVVLNRYTEAGFRENFFMVFLSRLFALAFNILFLDFI